MPITQSQGTLAFNSLTTAPIAPSFRFAKDAIKISDNAEKSDGISGSTKAFLAVLHAALVDNRR